MHSPEYLKELEAKLRAGKKLSRSEEAVYLIEVIGMDKEEVERIFAINDNKNKTVIID